jgi:hypothetical protein
VRFVPVTILLIAIVEFAAWDVRSLSAVEFGKVADPSGVTDVVYLQEPELGESSGLAVSNRNPQCFWSHNDSGGQTKLYAFDRRGHKSGQVRLQSTAMNDWEDMAAFLDEGVPRLLVADCGDNDSNRSHILLYLFDEPDPKAQTVLETRNVQTVRVTYPGGPCDCEAVAVDPRRKLILLLTKTKLPFCNVYAIPLPDRRHVPDSNPVMAQRVASVLIPMITACDFDASNGDLWVTSYFHTFHFPCPEREMRLSRQLSAMPQIFELPRWKQIEAVAIDRSRNLWVTSEGRGAPLGRLSPEALAKQRRP